MIFSIERNRTRRVIIPLMSLCVILACDVGQHAGEPTTAPESFGIYLTKYEVPPSALAAMSHVEPSPVPLLSLDDIVSYTWQSHVIHLTERGRRIFDTMSVPVHGRSFCVCVNRVTQYCGAFWTPISSLAFDGTTIMISKPVRDSIKIGRGYPSDMDTTTPDPRDDPDVRSVLEAAGKVR